MDAISSMLALNGSVLPEPVVSASPSNAGVATSSMSIPNLLSPSLFPVLLPPSPPPAFYNLQAGEFTTYMASTQDTSSTWPNIESAAGSSDSSDNSGNIFSLHSMTEQSMAGRRSPIVLSPNLILTDADLLSYLTGNGCPEALNELGLDIFQPERSMIDAEGQIQADAGREVHMMLALDPIDRFQYVILYLPHSNMRN